MPDKKFLLIEARPRLGGRMFYQKIFADAATGFEGYGVEMGANWIHGQHDEDYYDKDHQPKPGATAEFVNPVWKFKEEHPDVLEGDFTNYDDEIIMTIDGKKIEPEMEEQAWDEVEGAMDKCTEDAKNLWKRYCEGGEDLQKVEQNDTGIKDCVFKHMSHDAPMDRLSVGVRDAIMWEEIEFETGIFNNSLMHLLPLNNFDRKAYNDNDWFIKNGYKTFF